MGHLIVSFSWEGNWSLQRDASMMWALYLIPLSVPDFKSHDATQIALWHSTLPNGGVCNCKAYFLASFFLKLMVELTLYVSLNYCLIPPPPVPFIQVKQRTPAYPTDGRISVMSCACSLGLGNAVKKLKRTSSLRPWFYFLKYGITWYVNQAGRWGTG